MFNVNQEFFQIVAAIVCFVSMFAMLYFWFSFQIKSVRKKRIDRHQEKLSFRLIIISSAITGISLGLLEGNSKSFPWGILVCPPPFVLISFVGFRIVFSNFRLGMEKKFGSG